MHPLSGSAVPNAVLSDTLDLNFDPDCICAARRQFVILKKLADQKYIYIFSV